MCNSVNVTRSPVPAVDYPPALPADIASMPILIHGSIDPEGGLRGSVSASSGLKLHLEARARYCLSPQAAPDNLIEWANDSSWPLSRRDGETASLGLVRLLRTSSQAITGAESARFFCTLFLWAQEMAYEFDLRGGVALHLDPALFYAFMNADCQDAVLCYACALKPRFTVEWWLVTD